MVLLCFYDNSGRINKLVRGQENSTLTRHTIGNGNKGIVTKCPKEVYHMSTDEVRKKFRVKDAQGIAVELEHG